MADLLQVNKHVERRLSSSSLGWHRALLPSQAAPCCGGKFFQVSITHPKCLAHFSYTCSFTMISKFRAGMNDTCYPGLSARTGKKIPFSSYWYTNRFRQEIRALPFQRRITSKTRDIQKRGRHQAQEHGGSRRSISVLLLAVNHRNRIRSSQIEGQKASYRSILQRQPTWLPFVTR